MKPITSKLVHQMMNLAEKHLKGDWVIIGGSVLTVLGISERVTVDIDLAGPIDSTQKDVLKLMEIAESIGLDVEAINQAGAFFLHKIPKWQDELVVIQKGSNVRFLRPNLCLFIKLKCGRMSETDLSDCLVMIKYEKSQSNKLATNSLKKFIEKLADKESNESKRNRILEVLKNIDK
jgi:hypothetical protein